VLVREERPFTGALDLIAKAFQEAEKNGSGQKGPATSRLLHTSPKEPKSVSPNQRKLLKEMAGTMGLEPATSDVTGSRSGLLASVI
jgi:hypothetical protein